MTTVFGSEAALASFDPLPETAVNLACSLSNVPKKWITRQLELSINFRANFRWEIGWEYGPELIIRFIHIVLQTRDLSVFFLPGRWGLYISGFGWRCCG
jgi:hypothetical protein